MNDRMRRVATSSIETLISRERLPANFGDVVERIHRPIAERITALRTQLKRPILVGLSGPQGSGKSTAAAVLQLLLKGLGLRAAMLSIDDVYLTRAERAALARTVHPLLMTRGPPGTHDVGLLQSVVTRLLGGESLALPSFDKTMDERRDPVDWPWFDGPVDAVVLEGWCVGAVPQPPARLAAPVNALERDEDRAGVWRGFANDALGAYQEVFGRIDLLIQLRPTDFETVVGWRAQQEAKLRLQAAGQPGARVMTDAEIVRFVQHYERLTRYMLNEMPARADILVDLDAERRLRRLHFRDGEKMVPPG